MPRILAFSGSARSRVVQPAAGRRRRRRGSAPRRRGHLVQPADYPMPLFNQDLEDRDGMPEHTAPSSGCWPPTMVSHRLARVQQRVHPAAPRTPWTGLPVPRRRLEPGLMAFRSKVAVIMKPRRAASAASAADAAPAVPQPSDRAGAAGPAGRYLRPQGVQPRRLAGQGQRAGRARWRSGGGWPKHWPAWFEEFQSAVPPLPIIFHLTLRTSSGHAAPAHDTDSISGWCPYKSPPAQTIRAIRDVRPTRGVTISIISRAGRRPCAPVMSRRPGTATTGVGDAIRGRYQIMVDALPPERPRANETDDASEARRHWGTAP